MFRVSEGCLSPMLIFNDTIVENAYGIFPSAACVAAAAFGGAVLTEGSVTACDGAALTEGPGFMV